MRFEEHNAHGHELIIHLTPDDVEDLLRQRKVWVGTHGVEGMDNERVQKHSTLLTIQVDDPPEVRQTDWCKVHERPRCQPGNGTTSDGRHCALHERGCDFSE